MPFPETRRKLEDAGYYFITEKQCPCGARMELWHTPKDQVLPMNLMPDDDAKAESHFATCPKAVQFRRKKPVSAASNESHPEQTPPAGPSGPAQESPAYTTKSAPSPASTEADGLKRRLF